MYQSESGPFPIKHRCSNTCSDKQRTKDKGNKAIIRKKHHVVTLSQIKSQQENVSHMGSGECIFLKESVEFEAALSFN